MPISFTNKEQAVLNQLLTAETSLTASEIVARSESLNSNTVQSVVRSLLKRGISRLRKLSTAARYCAAATGLRKRQRMLPLRTSQRDFASCAKTCPLLKSLRG